MPPVVLERPKMSRAMWEALKSHILRERQRKKQELEADAEVERQRKERERQLKQDSMTLSETRDQIVALDSRLTSLKEEKHQLFMQLKKVLNEDETRRRQLLSKEASEMMPVHNYMPHPGLPMGSGPPQMMFQPVLARPAMYTVPRVAHAPQHGQPSLLGPRFEGSMKRSRTPSPPPQSHNYKFGPFKPPPQAIHPYPHKPSMPLQYYHTPVSQSPQPPPQQQSHHVSVSYSGGPHPQSQPPPPTMYTYAGAPPSRSPQSVRDEPKHVPTGLYLHPGTGIPRGYVVHQQIEHPSQSQKFAEDNQKYFPAPSHGLSVRGPTHLLHPGLSIQPPQGASSGGITSGYPIRTTPNSSYQGRPPSPHVGYAGQPGQARLSYSHPQHGLPTVSPHGQQVSHSHPQQVTISRYTLPPGISRD